MAIPTLYTFYTTSLIAFTPNNLEDECPICAISYREALSDVAPDVVATPCGHKFHRDCLDHWLRDGPSDEATCPNCRMGLCQRPRPKRDFALQCLDPALSDNWAEEKWEAIYLMEHLLKTTGLTDTLYEIVEKLFVILRKLQEDATGRLSTGLAWADIFQQAFPCYKDSLRTAAQSSDMSQRGTSLEEAKLLFPGGPGEYVAVRTILRAIVKSNRERGWVDSAVLVVLDRFGDWEKEETMSIVEAYRGLGFFALADEAEDETECVI
ncbi:hypothetical protein J4E81_001752 [Alternaria sp. BMP 2799]|nr:hypothetical protein J4E81_001752 [Alternaria sp. BMP 2799]